MILGWVLAGQAAQPPRQGIPLPTDWSHSHLIFSRPGSAELLARVSKDPRYQQQIHRREQALTLPASVDAAAFPTAILKASKKFHRDWSEDLGSLALVGPVLAGIYPAKFSFSSKVANCGSATTPDYVVYSTGLLGTGTQANIVAFDNLYSGCGVGVPTLYWAYNTAGQVLTSPVLSRDGKQVAFVQTNTGAVGTLVLLKWAASTGTIGIPATPTAVLPGAYSGCTAPCMTTIVLHDGSNLVTDDTTSSVFYDYTNDIGWVGGARGWLHKITGMFGGIPAEVHGGGFPAQVASTLPLSSPVYDPLSNNVFVGDGGGFLNSVNATSGLVTRSAQLDFGVGLIESPLVDTVNGFVYVFASSDNSSTCALGTINCSAVYQLSTTFGLGATGTEAAVGNSVASAPPNPNPLYIGGFDSAYYSSTNATGNLYVCGNTGANPILYQVPVLAGAFPLSGAGLPIVALTTGASTAACSPVTDVPNPNTTGGPSERMFVSVQSNGLPTTCSPGGCIMNFVSAAWKPSTTYVVGQQILSTKFHVETVTVGGTSFTSAPSWSNTAGSLKTDGSVVWIDQGALGAGTMVSWLANHPYGTLRILDTNNNVELSTPGTSGASQPIWNTTPGLTTTDNGVTWKNLGQIGTFALASAGGTSGIISDNAVGPGTLAGASQVYFTTLADQTCPSSGGSGGCAVQASQPALQ